jgi:AraC-like DNA-binding protein
MSFVALRARLVAAIRSHLADGYYSERELARVAGISQPHLHHILSGQRAGTPAEPRSGAGVWTFQATAERIICR